MCRPKIKAPSKIGKRPSKMGECGLRNAINLSQFWWRSPNRRFIIGLPALNWSGTGASVFGVVRNGGIKIWYTMVYPKITILMKLKNKPPIMMVNPWKYMEIGRNRSGIRFLDNKFDVSQRAKMPSTWRNQNQQAASGDWWPDPPRSCQLQDVTS